MKIPTSYLRMTAIAALAGGLFGCGGGGSGGGGGPAVPAAGNAAISPPPTTAVAITTGAQTTNTTIAAVALQAVNGAGVVGIGNGNSITPLGVEVQPAATKTMRLTAVELVRRHAGTIRDRKPSASVTGALVVDTTPCFVGGTQTLVFDNMNMSGNFSQIFVHCDEGGGAVFHGTISSTGVSFSSTLGNNAGDPYTESVAATMAIDLSVTTASPPGVLVSQGSLSFSSSFSGMMEPDGVGGVTPGFPTHFETRIFGTSLLGSDGVNSEQLSNFDLTAVDDDAAGTTFNGHFTYANSAINGAVTVNITTEIQFASGAVHPHAGVIEITSSVSGKIKVTILNDVSSSSPSVQVDVFANATDTIPVNTYQLTWADFDALA